MVFCMSFGNCTSLPHSDLSAFQGSFVEEIILPCSRTGCGAALSEQETEPLKDPCRNTVFSSPSKASTTFILGRSEIFTQAR